MIKGNKTISGIDIALLPAQSHEKVYKICDNCTKETIAALRDIYRGRIKRNDPQDLCHACSQKIQGLKRRKGAFLLGSGYLAEYKNDKRIFSHRKIIEDSLGRTLLKNEIVHHIDGNKLNNNIDNLIVLPNNNIHRSTHSSLEREAFKLVKERIIIFDKNSYNYLINPNFNNKIIEESIGFDKIAIKQKKNICNSRLEVDTQSEIIKGVFRPVPIIASNMSSVINSNFAIQLYKLGAFGILHRALLEENYLQEVAKVAKECEWVASSIGIGENQFELSEKLIKVGSNIIVIDIAHGYSDAVINLGRNIKTKYPNTKIVLGNTTNIGLLQESQDFVDAVKVGIAQGLACETSNTAGCTEKQFSAVLKFKEESKRLGIPIISDGGIREPADFVKSIAAGANSVMAGSIFARCPESAAEQILVDNKIKKVYFGMASRKAQDEWKGGLKPGTCPEGKTVLLDIGESVEKLLERYNGALKSGITYAGGKDIKSFQENVEFIRIL